jgi:hypothetical protein
MTAMYEQDCNTCVHLACFNGQVDVVESLLQVAGNDILLHKNNVSRNRDPNVFTEWFQSELFCFVSPSLRFNRNLPHVIAYMVEWKAVVSDEDIMCAGGQLCSAHGLCQGTCRSSGAFMQHRKRRQRGVGHGCRQRKLPFIPVVMDFINLTYQYPCAEGKIQEN